VSGGRKVKRLIAGVAKTGRTETFEDYYKSKEDTFLLDVIGQTIAFQKQDYSFFRRYAYGYKYHEHRLKSFLTQHHFLLPLVLLKWWWNIFICAEGNYDEYIGISHSFALFGVILKKLGRVKRVIYYCIDYYQNDPIMAWIDRINCHYADEVWDISQQINHQRDFFAYPRPKIVPLSYSDKYLHFKVNLDSQRLVFVGSLSDNQGLDIVIKAMPLIEKKYPLIHFWIIGDGYYRKEIEKIKGPNVSCFGFIEDDTQVCNFLASSAIGIAMFTTVNNKNILCADPGKIKLYAMCGLPVITTKHYKYDFGVIADETPEDFARAVDYLLNDKERLLEYKQRSYEWGKQFITTEVMKKIQ